MLFRAGSGRRIEWGVGQVVMPKFMSKDRNQAWDIGEQIGGIRDGGRLAVVSHAECAGNSLALRCKLRSGCHVGILPHKIAFPRFHSGVILDRVKNFSGEKLRFTLREVEVVWIDQVAL